MCSARDGRSAHSFSEARPVRESPPGREARGCLLCALRSGHHKAEETGVVSRRVVPDFDSLGDALIQKVGIGRGGRRCHQGGLGAKITRQRRENQQRRRDGHEEGGGLMRETSSPNLRVKMTGAIE